MVSSTESAITSREGSEDFMPSWPMAMPSVTVMVQNSRGVPPPAATLLHHLSLTHERNVAGGGLVPAGSDADEGLMDLLAREPHRVIVGALRSALGTLGHVPAGQLRLEVGLRVHCAFPPRFSRARAPNGRSPKLLDQRFRAAYGQIAARRGRILILMSMF